MWAKRGINVNPSPKKEPLALRIVRRSPSWQICSWLTRSSSSTRLSRTPSPLPLPPLRKTRKKNGRMIIAPSTSLCEDFGPVPRSPCLKSLSVSLSPSLPPHRSLLHPPYTHVVKKSVEFLSFPFKRLSRSCLLLSSSPDPISKTKINLNKYTGVFLYFTR